MGRGYAMTLGNQGEPPTLSQNIRHTRVSKVSRGLVRGDGLGVTSSAAVRRSETLTTAALATYAYDQIDQARAELNAVS